MSDCKCCKAVPGTGGEKYIPMEERTGEDPRYISPEIFPLRDFRKFLTV